MAKHAESRIASARPFAPLYVLACGAGAILLAVCIAYFPAKSGAFLLDDDDYLTENGIIKMPDGLYRFWFTSDAIDYYPVSNSTLWLEWRLWGNHPAGYHVTNVVIHFASALLVWAVLHELSIPGPFLAALLFAVHPVNVESVAWIAQRKDMLATLFFLLSLFWYFHGDPAPGAMRWYWLSLIAFLLAALSKGSVVTLPLVLLWITWYRRPVVKQDWLRTIPFLVIAVLVAIVNVWCQARIAKEPFRTADFSQRLLGAGTVEWFYLAKALLPINLTFVYPQWSIHSADVLWWLPSIATVVATLLLWRRRDRAFGRLLLLGWGFFCISLLPVMGFVDVGFMQYSLVADHYQHVAIISVTAAAASVWIYWRDHAPTAVQSLATGLAIAAVSVLIFMSWRQCRLYEDPRVFYQTIVDCNPDCYMAQSNLGLQLLELNQPGEAMKRFQSALRLKPNHAKVHNNLGLIYKQSGNLTAAISEYQEAVRLHPEYATAHNNLGNVLFKVGRVDDAIQQYKLAIQNDPYFGAAYYNLAVKLSRSGRPAESIDYFVRALQLLPDDVQTWQRLAEAYALLQRRGDAVAAARKGLESARSQRQSAAAERIQAWLSSYEAAETGAPQIVPPLSEP